MSSAKPRVAIIMGSDSDLPKMELAETILSDFKIPYEIKIVSAHRTPRFMQTWATKAKSRGIQVIIAGAGGAAHLPGMVASLTPLPVIGVPILVGKLDGLDALLSIAQMPKGVPVATMAVDNSFNAGLLAARILGLQDKRIAKKLIDFEANQRKKVGRANGRLKKDPLSPAPQSETISLKSDCFNWIWTLIRRKVEGDHPQLKQQYANSVKTSSFLQPTGVICRYSLWLKNK